MFRFEKLEVWKLAIQYCNKIYQTTDTFPKYEKFGLTSQLNRAGVSIPSNIAEGSGSVTVNDFCHYLDISIKSTLESVSELMVAELRGYITYGVRAQLYEEAEILVKKIQNLKKYLKKPRATSHELRADLEVVHG